MLLGGKQMMEPSEEDESSTDTDSRQKNLIEMAHGEWRSA